MNAEGFDELCQHFTDKLSGVCEALAIQSCLGTAEEEVHAGTVQSMESLWQGVDEMSDILTLIRSKCADQRKGLLGVQALQEKLQLLIKGAQYTVNNIPPHLPVLCTTAAHESQRNKEICLQESVESTAQIKAHGPTETASNNNSNKAVSLTSSKTNAKISQQQRPPCPVIEYLTVDEFNSVPKYMKGRMSYQQVNSVIDELNKAFTIKYKLMRQKRSTMSDVNRKRYEILKRQECKETEGVYFLVDQDVKEWSSLKMSKETHSIFTVLRHCGRMCEVRSDGYIRYAIIEMY